MVGFWRRQTATGWRRRVRKGERVPVNRYAGGTPRHPLTKIHPRVKVGDVYVRHIGVQHRNRYQPSPPPPSPPQPRTRDAGILARDGFRRKIFGARGRTRVMGLRLDRRRAGRRRRRTSNVVLREAAGDTCFGVHFTTPPHHRRSSLEPTMSIGNNFHREKVIALTVSVVLTPRTNTSFHSFRQGPIFELLISV